MKRLLIILSLALALFAGASVGTANAMVPTAPIGDGGGQGVCGPWAGVAFTVTPRMYSVGLVPRYNAQGQQTGWDYRYGTSRWYCTAVSGPVWNYVTGGYSVFTGWAWVALDLWDYPGV